MSHAPGSRVGVLGQVDENGGYRSDWTSQNGPHVLGNCSEHHVGLAASGETMPLCNMLDRVCRDVGFDLVAALEAKPVSGRHADSTQHQILAACEAGQLSGMRLEGMAHSAITQLSERLRQTLLLQCD